MARERFSVSTYFQERIAELNREGLKTLDIEGDLSALSVEVSIAELQLMERVEDKLERVAQSLERIANAFKPVGE